MVAQALLPQQPMHPRAGVELPGHVLLSLEETANLETRKKNHLERD